MRGSVYYQSAELTKAIFCEGVTKEERIDPIHANYQKIASYKTMESYRNIWNNFFNYLKEHWGVRDFETISIEHIAAYMEYKSEYYPSKQYLEKISAALGKLEIALRHYSRNKYHITKEYDFSVRQKILDEAKDLELVADNYHNRAYNNPDLLISYLIDPQHRLAATIQYEGGARVEGVSLIRKEQLFGIKYDAITKEQKGIIWTKEKGGKEGEVLVSLTTYSQLEVIVAKDEKFKLNRVAYAKDIRDGCHKLGIIADGSHGFRWNFAKRRLFEYAKAGYSYEQSLQAVSWEMKHNRASITEHYLA
ncbi:MAG: hypothetical protein PHE67_07395 [Campylobacterales bacterium]|nr:hypothetical protein [Campylobacterales bacterium]